MSTQCAPATDPDFLTRLQNKKQIVNYFSNLGFVNPAGTYCLRVPNDTLDTPLSLKLCSQAIKVNPIVNNAVYTATEIKDNDFYYDTNNKRIYVLRQNNLCLQANGNRIVSATCNMNNTTNANQKFQVQGKVIKSLQTDKCLTAPDFVKQSEANYNAGKTTAIPEINVVLGECPSSTSLLTGTTIFSNLGDSLFQFGTEPNLSGIMYMNLVDMYKQLIDSTAGNYASLQTQFTAAEDNFNKSIAESQALYDQQVQLNEKLQQEIVNNKKRTFHLIVAQTESIKTVIESLEKGNKTEYKNNNYQLEQNKQIQQLHKILFWIYFVAVFIFIAIVLLVSPMSSWIFSIFIIVGVIVYPFIIIFIEYAFAFLYYYCSALIFGHPFVMNKLPPTHSVFFTP